MLLAAFLVVSNIIIKFLKVTKIIFQFHMESPFLNVSSEGSFCAFDSIRLDLKIVSISHISYCLKYITLMLYSEYEYAYQLAQGSPRQSICW